MGKILVLTASIISLVSSTNAVAQNIEGLNDLPQMQQQQKSTELTEEESKGILSVACNDPSNRNRSSIARELASEIDASLSRKRLNELTEAVLEIKNLPREEKTALCQI